MIRVQITKPHTQAKKKMGHVLSGYVVEGKNLFDAIGAKDRLLVNKIIDSNLDEFDDEEDFPSDSERPSLRRALECLIHHGFENANDDPQFRYAFEEVLRFVGECAFADRYDPDEIGLNRFEDSPLPLPLENSGDFPKIVFVPHESVAMEVERVSEQDEGSIDEFSLVPHWIRALNVAKKRKADIWLVYG